MGQVMFEVGLFLFAVVFYFVIGYYYHVRYGMLLSLGGLALYGFGLAFGLNIPLRLGLLALPLLVMVKRKRVTNLEFDKTKLYCPKCGWPNEPDAGFCRGLHCGAPLERGPDTSQWTYYFPPRVILLVGAVVSRGAVFMRQPVPASL